MGERSILGVRLNRSEYYWHILNNFGCHAAIYSDKLRQMCVIFLMHVQMLITFFFFNTEAVVPPTVGKHKQTQSSAKALNLFINISQPDKVG